MIWIINVLSVIPVCWLQKRNMFNNVPPEMTGSIDQKRINVEELIILHNVSEVKAFVIGNYFFMNNRIQYTAFITFLFIFDR